MYDIKCKRGGSDALMSDMLGLMQRAFHDTDAQLPRSFYEAKKTVTKMGLSYTKIDVCRYDCMLFWEDDASLEKCKRCNTDRYLPKSESRWATKRAVKSMRYFPLGPRLQRLYMCPKTAEHMSWHGTETNIDLDCYVRAQRFPQDKVLLSRYKKYPTQTEAEVYKIEMQKVKASIPMEKADSTVTYIVGIIWAGAFLLYAWLLVIIIKLVLSIRRGEVFVSKVSKSIEKIGILLAVIYLFDLLCGYLLYSYFISTLHIAQYDIIFASSANEMFLIMGLVLMILSQIILMGKEIKEEQELTI